MEDEIDTGTHEVYTSTGYDSDDIPTLDHSAIASKGYMLRANDWRNFEMTQYVKVNTSPSDDNLVTIWQGWQTYWQWCS